MFYKIAQLSLSPSSKSTVASDIFIAQPDSIKEGLAGKLFVLIEIEQNTSTSIKIINFLIDTLNHNYYQNEKILLRERVSTLKVEHIFEAVLAKSNKFFNEFLENEKINLSGDAINITVGVIHDNELHFASSGKNKVFLVYEAPKNKDSRDVAENKDTYKTVDITKQSKGDEKSAGKIVKLFSNVVSGPIPKNGTILISNEALPEYISNKKLTEIVTTLPPIGAVEQIKNTLAAINSYVSFSGIIIKNTTTEQSVEPTYAAKRSTEESISNLNRTEESTENLLTPSGVINFKKWAKLLSSAFRGKRQMNKSNYESQLNLKDKIFVKKKGYASINQLGSIFKNIFSFVFKALFHSLTLLSQKNKVSNIKNKVKNYTGNKLDQFFSKLSVLSKRSKVLMILGIFLLIFFFYNLSVMKTNIEVEEKQENYQEIASLIEQKQNQAEANLLYSNEEGAKKLFDEIKELMNSLPQETEEQIQKYNDFNSKFNAHMETIRRLTRLDTEELADFSNLNNQANPENIILNNNSKIYSGDSEQKSIYILDTKDNLITTITDLSLPIISLKEPAKNGEEFIYYISGSNIIEFSIEDEQLKTYPIVPENSSVENIDTYNNRLYVLDSKDSSILRYNKATNEFNSPYAWLSSKNDLTKAVDLSIDGHVYVLTSDAKVIKFLKGELIDFKLENIDPPLSAPNKILVSPENKFIYILESSTRRLIIYDKTGQFIIQYTSDNFNDIKDFQVNEESGELFFLNGTKVLKANSNHMNE